MELPFWGCKIFSFIPYNSQDFECLNTLYVRIVGTVLNCDVLKVGIRKLY